MDTSKDTRSPDEIERDIRRTQHQMSDTADRLGDQLTPRNIVDGLLDKADENGIDARYMLDAARRNPIALGMIAIGGIWLASESDARLKTLKPAKGDGANSDKEFDGALHRSYTEHMMLVEPRADEDTALYLRRRDCARATFFLIEQETDEDESAFRQRLDDATASMRERRERMMDSLHSAGNSTRQGAGAIASKASSAYRENPLLGGLAAAFVGAIAGAAVPISRTEEDQMGEMGSEALDLAKDKATRTKDRLVDKADEKMNKSRSGDDKGGQREKMPNPQYDTV